MTEHKNIPLFARHSRLHSVNSRPNKHTVGYVFFDVFNQNQVQNPVLKSIKFPAKEGEVNEKCLSFWFSPFGRSEVTMLSVYQTIEGSIGDADIGETAPAASPSAAAGGDGSSTRRLIWQIQTRKYDTRRPQWYYGQTTVSAATPHEVCFLFFSCLSFADLFFRLTEQRHRGTGDVCRRRHDVPAFEARECIPL